MISKESSSSLEVAELANLRPSQAAAYLGISVSKLAKLRMRHSPEAGPRFAKVAGCVLYRRADLDAWLEAHLAERARPQQ